MKNDSGIFQIQNSFLFLSVVTSSHFESRLFIDYFDASLNLPTASLQISAFLVPVSYQNFFNRASNMETLKMDFRAPLVSKENVSNCFNIQNFPNFTNLQELSLNKKSFIHIFSHLPDVKSSNTISCFTFSLIMIKS